MKPEAKGSVRSRSRGPSPRYGAGRTFGIALTVAVLGYSIALALDSADVSPSAPLPMIGMVDRGWGSDTLWLMIADTTLARGDTLTLLWNPEGETDEPPAKLERGTVLARVPRPLGRETGMYAEEGDVFYRLAATDSERTMSGLGFALRARPEEFRRVGKHVEIDLDRNGTPERFHMCASYEGLHLNVWSGEPKTGTLRWNRYYPVPYDTEPTCFEDSTEGEPEDATR